MATPIITHKKVTSGTVNSAVEVDLHNWNDTHTVTGLENVQNVDTTHASGIINDSGIPGTTVADALSGLAGRQHDYDTVAALQAATVPAIVLSLRIAGYYSVGDGGKFECVRDNTGDRTSNGGTVTWKVSDAVKNPLMYGAKFDGTDAFDDAPAVRLCVAATPDYAKMRWPNGVPYLNSVDSNNAVISLVDKAINIEGDGWDFTGGGSTAAPRGALFRTGTGIPDTADGILLKGTRSITGFRMSGIAFVPNDNTFGAGNGRDWFRIDATGTNSFGHSLLTIERCFFGNTKTGYSIHTLASSANGGGALANSEIINCDYMNGRFENVGDNVTIQAPTQAQNATNDVRDLGIYFYNTPGATNFRVIGGNNSAFNGMIVCDGGTAPIFDGIEFEQSAGFANTHGSMIDMNGGVSQIVGYTIINCNLSQDSVTGTRPTPIRLNNTDGGSVSNTRISIPDASVTHITITAAAAYPYIDHASNNYYTAGVRVTTGMVSNASPTLNSRPPQFNALPTGTALAAAATANTIAVRDASANLAVNGLSATAQISNTLSNGGPGAPFLSAGANAAYAWENPANAVDQKYWDILAQGATYTFRAVNDANSSAVNWMTVTRGVGTVVTGVAIGPPLTVTNGLAGTPAAPTAAVDTNTTQIATAAFVLAQAGSATPLIDGSATVGASTRFARQDHIHPTDTTRAALASPTFTGTPAAPTAAVDTNTTQLATTAMVLAQSASATPLANGVATVGTSTRFARGDHVHPSTFAGSFVNKFRNATMDIWQRGTSALAAGATTVNAYTADGWIINATYSAGAGPVMSQVANSRTGALTQWALKILGATNCTDAILKQRIEGTDAAAFGTSAVTIQAQIRNDTGGSITPTLTVKYPTATDNYTSTTTDGVASAVSLQACANSAVTQVSYTFTPSGSVALGMEVSIDFGNNFSANTKSVSVSEADIRATPGLAAGLNSSPPIPEMRPIHTEVTQCQRYLVGYNAGVGTTFYFAFGGAFSTTQAFCTFALPNMRISPTGLTVSSAGHFVATDGSATQKTLTALTMGVVSPVAAVLLGTVASGLTLGQTSAFGSQSASAQLLFTGAEL